MRRAEPLGMWPVVAESGAAALKLLESVVQPIPLVLTDVHMPEMDGFELLKQSKMNLGTPTVIMLTSGSYAGDVTRGRDLGAEAYLIKPVRRSELLQSILQILKDHSPSTQRIADLLVPARNWQLRGQKRKAHLITVFTDLLEVAAFGF